VFELALFTDVLTYLSGVLLSVVNSDVICYGYFKMSP